MAAKAAPQFESWEICLLDNEARELCVIGLRATANEARETAAGLLRSSGESVFGVRVRRAE